MFRYWDGGVWSAATTNNPYGAPPSGLRGGSGAGGAPLGRGAVGGTQGSPLGAPRKRSPIGWILAAVGAVVVVVLVVVGVLILRNREVVSPQDPEPAPTESTAITCPPTPSQRATPTPDRGGDRVTSGHLSYPRLSYPFSAPFADPRTPFGRDVQSQAAVVERMPDGKGAWVADVLIARLLAGDGFYGPKQGAEVVATCALGKFYGDTPVQRKDVRNQATKIDGHDAWLIEMRLAYNIPGVKAKGETATIVVVDTGATDGEAGLFYSSVPDTSPQFTKPAAGALNGLRVR